MNEIDVDDLDVRLCPIIEWLDELGISRAQQHAAIRDRIAVAQDGGVGNVLAESRIATKH